MIIIIIIIIIIIVKIIMTIVILIIIIATTILKVLLRARETRNVSTVVIINCQRRFGKPAISEIEILPITVNNFQSLTIVAKSSILFFSGFLNPSCVVKSLLCSPSKAADWFKPRKINIHAYRHTYREVFKKTGEASSLGPSFIDTPVLQPQLT